jgi:hypothetical protein
MVVLKLFLCTLEETYFISTTGTNSESCSTLENACGTVDYVMLNRVNNSGASHIVIVESGFYDYVYASNSSLSYGNFMLNIAGDLSPSSEIDENDVTTYPIISSVNPENLDYGFFFHANVTALFHHLSFVISNKAYSKRHFFGSFRSSFFFFFLFIPLFFSASVINDNISLVITDCLFSSPQLEPVYPSPEWVFIIMNHGDFSVVNCFIHSFYLLYFIFFLITQVFL